ncbi:hypothetical protein ILP92_11000 [Maribius pontilimi]|uniref:Uncharacterized protein n=1 Tax=Palleronia pontilimi TaxID=1964209 RepID=A0A934IJU5_9RHOB|nr:hypothetical protein [Palleronia pontilimi]MBJ3763274.1 hypothetical protein [Palleronia pontilimi]
MGDVVMLMPRERMSRDLERLLAVNDRTGDEADIVATEMDTAMEEWAETLSRIAVAYRARKLRVVAQAARDAAEQARHLGLNRAFRVGQAVSVLSTQGDDVALAANIARLMRLGDAALSSVWEQRDSCF